MADLNGIHFSTPAARPAFDDALVGVVPGGIADTDELLARVALALSFPAWFGGTFNGLYDCLRDFHWTERRQIVLLHADVPHIPADELREYLDALQEAAADWQAETPHRLAIFFDKSVEPALRKLLARG